MAHNKLIPPSSYDISNAKGEVRGVFHKQAQKQCQEVRSELRSHKHMLRYVGHLESKERLRIQPALLFNFS